MQGRRVTYHISMSSKFSPHDSLQSAEMEMYSERNINGRADVIGKWRTALRLIIHHQLGRVFILRGGHGKAPWFFVEILGM